MGFGHVLNSPLSLRNTWRRNGSGALVHPGKQAATARKWLISYFLDCSRCQPKVFLIRIHNNQVLFQLLTIL